MPASSTSRHVADEIRENFDYSEDDAVLVLMRQAPDDPEQIARFAQEMAEDPHVSRVDASTGIYLADDSSLPASEQSGMLTKDGSTFLVATPSAEGLDRPDDMISELRALDAPEPIELTGLAAANVDTTEAVLGTVPLALVVTLVVMIVLLFLVTGSVLLPLLSVVLSALSLTASFGALVWIFQDGHLAGVFGDVAASGNIAATVPVLMFALAFGLAMDYQIFILSRMTEEYERTGSPDQAIVIGIMRTGRIVTAAAILIAVVFSAFAVSKIGVSRAYGVGLPLAVLIDATLIRGALPPASMRLLGPAAWWSSAPLRRLHDRWQIKE